MSSIRLAIFFDEVKRRSVVRLGVAYLVAAWLLIQIADTVFPYIGVPEYWTTRLIGILAVGLLPTLIVAWLFEWTPQGIRRDDAGSTSAVRATGRRRKIDYVIIGMLTIAVALFSYDRFVSPIIGRVPLTVIANANPAVAVLPFENRSAREGDVYFVDGVHDDILTSLAKIGSLKVISRTSVEQYRGTHQTMPEIGAELGVTAILEGGVQRAGNRIRVNVQLIDVATDSHQWAEIYDRELTTSNIFAIQSEISNTIARALQATLLPEEKNRIEAVPTDNLQAYESYLLGKEQLRRRRGVSLERAIDYFQEAIDLDPLFALAYVGLADSYLLMRSYTNRPWSELRPLAQSAAKEAIQLDADLGEAYANLAMIHYESRENDAAGPLFVQALELSPNYATGRQWYTEYLGRTGNREAALEQIQMAFRLDPLSPIINHIYAGILTGSGRFAEAEARWKRAIEIDPEFARAYQGLAALYYRNLGRLDEAAVLARNATLLNPDVAANYALLSNIFLYMGDSATARRWLDEANRLDADNTSAMLATSMYYLLQRDFDAAVQVADRGLTRQPRGRWYLSVKVDHLLSAGRAQEAKLLLESAYPELVPGDGMEVDLSNASMATILARIYQQAGLVDRATALLERTSEFFYSYPGTSTQFGVVMEARLLSLMGRKQQAINALREEFESGWRYLALYLIDYAPTLDAIREETEFAELARELKDDLARQREALRVAWDAEFN